MTQTLIPSQHLKNTASKTAPKLLLVGDSIATPTPGTTFDDSASLWGLLRREFAIQNPGRTPVWANRAISGTRWDHLSATRYPTLDDTNRADNVPASWGVDTSTTSWHDVLVAQEPDAIFFNFGMNDRDVFVENNFQQVILDLQADLPNTDLVIITNMIPNFYSTNDNGGMESQNGRLYVAERQRSFARYFGYGLIDIGRAQGRMVAGFDPDRTTITRASNVVDVSTPYSMPETDRDFGLVFDLPVTATTWNTRLRMDLGFQSGLSQSWLEIYRDAGGNLAVEYAVLDNVLWGRFKTTVSDIAAPTTGNLSLSIFVQGQWASIEADGELLDEGIIQRGGGRFAPTLSFLDDRAVDFSATPYTASFVSTKPVTTFAEFFGVTDISRFIEGGNEVNHPAAAGWSTVFAEVMKEVDFHLPSVTALDGVVRVSGTLPPLDDDATLTLPAPADVGTLVLWSENTGTAAQVSFVATSSPAVQHSVLGSNTELATPGTNLTGTTGSDGAFTISVKDGEIELENRRGVTAIGTLRYAFIAPTE